MVVMSGPEATAGSMWILWNSMGMMVPTKLETTIAMMSATRRSRTAGRPRPTHTL